MTFKTNTFIFSFFVFHFAYSQEKDLLTKGGALYATNCAMCHGKTGKGEGAVGKNLTPKLQPLTKYNEKKIIEILESENIPMMRSYKKSLSFVEKEAIAKYIQTINKK